MSLLNFTKNHSLQKFTRNFWSVLSVVIIVAFGLMALLAYVIAPDNSQNANQMHLSIHSKPPGFQTKVFILPRSEISNNDTSFWKKILFGKIDTNTEIPYYSHAIQNQKLILFTSKEEADLNKAVKEIPLHHFQHSDINTILLQHSHTKTFFLGTDRYGRDLWSRLLIGSRISFSIGFIAVLISLIIGISLGATAGYFGGYYDAFIMWIINVVWSIPTLLLVIAITLALGKGLFQVYIAVGLTMWVEVARIVRGQVLSVKQQQYITAAKTLGFGHFRTLWFHILPNSIGPVIIISAANFASAILIESGLSFLGIGAQPPTPSWGAMIKDHYSYIILGKAYLAIIPGVAIMLLVMSFMLLGNGIRDILDVKK